MFPLRLALLALVASDDSYSESYSNSPELRAINAAGGGVERADTKIGWGLASAEKRFENAQETKRVNELGEASAQAGAASGISVAISLPPLNISEDSSTFFDKWTRTTQTASVVCSPSVHEMCSDHGYLCNADDTSYFSSLCNQPIDTTTWRKDSGDASVGRWGRDIKMHAAAAGSSGCVGYCNCVYGYSGGDCSEASVTNIAVCSGHGHLIDSGLGFGRQCDCFFGFERRGEECIKLATKGAKPPRVAVAFLVYGNVNMYVNELPPLLNDLDRNAAAKDWELLIFYGPADCGFDPKRLKAFTTRTAHAVPVVLEFPPLHKDAWSKNPPRDSCYGGNSPMNYKHMGRFRAVSMWRLSIVRQYDYIVFMDTGLRVGRFPCDPIKQMVASRSVFGYFGTSVDADQCSGDTDGLAHNYLKQQNLTATIPYNILNNDGLVYVGAFVFFKVSFWLQEGLLNWTDTWDNSGLQYLNRSDEQKVWAKTVGIFAPPASVHKFGVVWNPSILHIGSGRTENWAETKIGPLGFDRDFQIRPSYVVGKRLYYC
jgi:hypothetical protein